MVFIFNPNEQSLWLISHNEIRDDIISKYDYDSTQALELLKGLYYVCSGNEPDDVLNRLHLRNTIGLPVETILKVYKWIWGQEDCNYPTKKGRWLSMSALLDRFNINTKDFR